MRLRNRLSVFAVKSTTYLSSSGDGKIDIAVANAGSGGGRGSFTILRVKGDGTFTITPSESIGCNPVSVAIADFNKDGKPDLAVFNGGSTEATILLNTSASNTTFFDTRTR